MIAAIDHSEITNQIGTEKALFLNAQRGVGLVNAIVAKTNELGLNLFQVTANSVSFDLFLPYPNDDGSTSVALSPHLLKAEVIIFDEISDPAIMANVYDVAANHELCGTSLPSLKTVIVLTSSAA